MTNISDEPKWTITNYEKIGRVKYFRYPGEVIQQNRLEEKEINVTMRKLGRTCRLIKKIYNKTTINIGAENAGY